MVINDGKRHFEMQVSARPFVTMRTLSMLTECGTIAAHATHAQPPPNKLKKYSIVFLEQIKFALQWIQ